MRTKPRKISTAEHRRHLYGSMPPLPHWDHQGHFQWKNSAVCKYLAAIGPNLALPVLFARAQDACAIIFDAETGLWRGCHYVEPGKAQESVKAAEDCIAAACISSPNAGPGEDRIAGGVPMPPAKPKWKLRWRDAKEIARVEEGRKYLLVSGAVDEGLLKTLIPELAKKA